MKLDPLLTKIEDALELHQISATKFGYLVAGDPTLIPKMRGGRRPRQRMRETIEAALQSLKTKGTL